MPFLSSDLHWKLSEEPAGGGWRVSVPGAGPPPGGWGALLLGGGLACFSGLLSCWLIPLSADTGDSLFWIPDPGLPLLSHPGKCRFLIGDH